MTHGGRYAEHVAADRRFRLSRAIKAECENGRNYYAPGNKPILETVSLDARPAREYLEWHSNVRFKG